MMKYKDIVPIGTVLITSATSFGLGIIYSNWPYDLNTLWKYGDSNDLNKSLIHYQTWGNSPMYIHYTLHVVAFLGLIGHFIKLYKPDEDAKYFEYGSLGLFMISIIIYLTNLRTGVNSCITGEWGDVDFATGINVMAASQIMILLALVGVLVLQGGLYYAQWYDEKLKLEFYENEAKEAALAAEKQAKDEVIASETAKVGPGSESEIIDVDVENEGSTGTKNKKKSIKKRKS
ncbi:SHR3 [Candida pseudojiufengensis]|uniref:SHR3 n=1 Tax=Candida pseudojiufengensis TaxID=497109 RepID=UPI0022253D4E|nr:SHR3 [Candida pseudojiufengensis]KAI5965631.1 SHR3 [Candida pseudojiufengensis]